MKQFQISGVEHPNHTGFTTALIPSDVSLQYTYWYSVGLVSLSILLISRILEGAIYHKRIIELGWTWVFIDAFAHIGRYLRILSRNTTRTLGTIQKKPGFDRYCHGLRIVDINEMTLLYYQCRKRQFLNLVSESLVELHLVLIIRDPGLARQKQEISQELRKFPYGNWGFGKQ